LLVGFTDSDWVVTLMIKSLLQVMFSALVLDLSLGLVRNNKLFLFLQQKQSTKQWLMQVKKPCGFNRSFQSLDSNNNIQPPSGVTIRVPSSSPKIQFNINTTNTLSYTCTSSESSFMIELLKCSFSLQKIKLQTHFHKVSYRSEVFQTSIYVRSSGSCH
jgi:hypothetical protein